MKTTETFIGEASKKHKNKYLYKETTYKHSKEKVIITCPIHGNFLQKPNDHLNGYGCIKCGGKEKYTLDIFIEKSSKVHENKYDYSKAIYKNSSTKIEIICLEHGSFWQTPATHLFGQGCPSCAGKKKLTTEEFIIRAQQIHKNEFNYSKVEYKNLKEKVEILCEMHGSFYPTPDDHLNRKSGCPSCSRTKRLTTEEFITRSNITHNNFYDYSKSKYINNSTKIEIVCNKHGSFKQIPGDHIRGKGCKKCSNNISLLERKWLESNNIPESHRQKTIKINKDKWYIVDGFDPATNTIYEFLGDFWHGNPLTYQQDDMNVVSKKTFGTLYKETFDRFEILKNCGYNLIYVWESEFANGVSHT